MINEDRLLQIITPEVGYIFIDQLLMLYDLTQIISGFPFTG
ncbi:MULTISPECIES: hypothetical protein [unclassified Anabaena]|nr:MULTISPECIES: hypothetical protein [unclassified Anabaena]